MTLTGLVEQTVERIDRLKYHNEAPDCLAMLETLLEQLRELESEFEDTHAGCIDTDDRDADLNQLLNKFISDVLENPNLKTRGDMIKAAKAIEI